MELTRARIENIFKNILFILSLVCQSIIWNPHIKSQILHWSERTAVISPEKTFKYRLIFLSLSFREVTLYIGRSLPLNSEPFEDSEISSKSIGSSIEDELTISKTSLLLSLLTGVPRALRYSMPLLPLTTKIISPNLFIAFTCWTSDLEKLTSLKLIGKPVSYTHLTLPTIVSV